MDQINERAFSLISKKLKTNIAFLQETHLQIADQVRLRKPWVGQIFHSHFNSKTRGATIVIQKKVQFNASKYVSDPQGCFVIVTGYLFLIPVVLVCVYDPKLGRFIKSSHIYQI